MDSESDEREPIRAKGAGASGGKAAKRSGPLGGESDFRADDVSEDGDEATGPIPEMVRKALAVGLAGFFSTEHTIRKALGDTVPREWVDFVSSQSERTRGDLTDAIAQEVGRTLRSIDLTHVADQLLTGRTLEVSARIRLLPLDNDNDHSHDGDGDEAEENDT